MMSAVPARSESHNDLAVLLHRYGTVVDTVVASGISVPRFTGEFWTSRQRQASSLHEISYRACFKPQLAAFFIEHFTQPGDTVYDPFSGRGTTVIEAGLLGRNVIANDVNPLSALLSRPRFVVPELDEVRERLSRIPMRADRRADIDVSMFYHRRTESEIVALKAYLDRRRRYRNEDRIDRWIRMVATNRLSGHSPGFFSVYTLPPNQAVTQSRQRLINKRLRQKPEYRDTRKLMLRKTHQLIRSLTLEQSVRLHMSGKHARFLTNDARHTGRIPDNAVALTVTSPPFLNMVDYASDNWLRCWFNGIDAEKAGRSITTTSSLAEWEVVMGSVFQELFRISRPGGWVAFEVGEVRKGNLRLDEVVVPLGVKAGFACRAIVINQQSFTKTSNIWGVRNNRGGTNTNRIVVFEKS